MGHFHSVDGTTANYSPLQGWSNNKNYAFFAFYPHDLTLVNRDGSTPYSGGVPAVKYTMDAPEEYPEEGPADGATLKASMVDLMTASPHNDLYWKSSSDNSFLKDEDETNDTKGALGEINFSFSHRLACLGLNIKNQSSGIIKIDGVTITVSGLKHQELIIPLDPSANITIQNPTIAPLDPVQFDIDTKLNLPEGQSDLSISNGASKELDDKLIFIPQDDVNISLTVEYTRYVDDYTEHTDSYSKYNLHASLSEGQKSLINLSFNESTVNVTVGCMPWTDKYTVDNSFN